MALHKEDNHDTDNTTTLQQKP